MVTYFDNIIDIDLLLNLDKFNSNKLNIFFSKKNNILFAIYFYCKLGMVDKLNYVINIISEDVQLYECVKNSKENNEFLCIACNNGYYDIVKILLEFGVDSNYLNGKPLIISVQKNHANIVELLLKNGADTSKMSEKISKICCIHNYYEIFNLLIENGIFLLDYYKNLLNLCFEYNSAECAKLLIKYGNDHIDYQTFNNYKILDEEEFLNFSDNDNQSDK
ncbi:repeat protein [Moumouvirus goulette]|uniref:Repeat protein n=1 Tax=Moumouvirus goulette TaxID=1247379 RepID=M1NNC6_9VIRU|nr:repeat protein [Moumouvirus goulette]AGF85555.1 repeat protein [Moumouvirus goulette]